MVIGFNEQFPDKILAGTKKHTIREDQYDRWHAGMKMHMAVGVRTKSYLCFKLDTCKSTQKITIIHYPKKAVVYVDDHRLGIYSKTYERTYYQKLIQLAKFDGFNSLKDFFDWFDNNFTGKIIHWTDLRY